MDENDEAVTADPQFFALRIQIHIYFVSAVVGDSVCVNVWSTALSVSNKTQELSVRREESHVDISCTEIK